MVLATLFLSVFLGHLATCIFTQGQNGSYFSEFLSRNEVRVWNWWICQNDPIWTKI